MGLFGGASSTSVSSSDEAKSMTVYVTIGEQNMQCEVQRGSRVSDVKAKVKEQHPNVMPSQMHMTYKDSTLSDGQQLKEYGIKNRSRIMCTVQ